MLITADIRVYHQTRNSIGAAREEEERERTCGNSEGKSGKKVETEETDGSPAEGKERKGRRTARVRLRCATCLAHRLRTCVYMQTRRMGRRDDDRQSTRGKKWNKNKRKSESKAEGRARKDASGRTDGRSAEEEGCRYF